jgi:hypothetical protein
VVWYHPFIQIPVVLYRAKLSIFLSDKEEAAGIRGVRSVNSL